MEGAQGDDPDIQAAALVSAGILRDQGPDSGLDQATASRRVSAAVRAIQEAPDDIRRRCILLAAAEPRWYGDTLLSLIGGKPAGLTADDLASLLPALTEAPARGQQSLAKTGADVLLSQAEAIWVDLDDAGRAGLARRSCGWRRRYTTPAAAMRLRKLAAPDTGSALRAHR